MYGDMQVSSARNDGETPSRGNRRATGIGDDLNIVVFLSCLGAATSAGLFPATGIAASRAVVRKNHGVAGAP
jgi:hypothetical protein